MAKKKTDKKKKSEKKKSLKKKLLSLRLKKKDAKKKEAKKKDSKKKDSKKKDSKKKDSKKKEKKKKVGKKKDPKKPLKAELIIDKPVEVIPVPIDPPADVVVEHSSDYSVTEAVKKLRTLKTKYELLQFIKGEKRITVTKVVPAALNRPG